jgi:hypothetical protein
LAEPIGFTLPIRPFGRLGLFDRTLPRLGPDSDPASLFRGGGRQTGGQSIGGRTAESPFGWF